MYFKLSEKKRLYRINIQRVPLYSLFQAWPIFPTNPHDTSNKFQDNTIWRVWIRNNGMEITVLTVYTRLLLLNVQIYFLNVPFEHSLNYCMDVLCSEQSEAIKSQVCHAGSLGTEWTFRINLCFRFLRFQSSVDDHISVFQLQLHSYLQLSI